MRRFALVALAAALAACGGEDRPSSEEVAFVPPSPPQLEPLGADEDSAAFLSEPDSLVLDSLASVVDSTLAEGPAPSLSFAPFFQEFKQALQTDDLARFAAPSLPAVALEPLENDAAFRQRVLATSPDEFRRDGTRREVWVVVGFDLEGNVVPEDEAETESGLGLVFDVVDGAYRLVQVNAAG